VVFIIAKFIGQIDCDQHTGGQADREAENIDEGKNLAFGHIPPGNL
jgi:hypothetical protein